MGNNTSKAQRKRSDTWTLFPSRDVIAAKDIRLFDIQGFPTGELIKKGTKGRIYGFYGPTDSKVTVLFGSEYLMIPTRYLTSAQAIGENQTTQDLNK